jgi:hypothetical protein
MSGITDTLFIKAAEKFSAAFKFRPLTLPKEKEGYNMKPRTISI